MKRTEVVSTLFHVIVTCAVLAVLVQLFLTLIQVEQIVQRLAADVPTTVRKIDETMDKISSDAEIVKLRLLDNAKLRPVPQSSSLPPII